MKFIKPLLLISKKFNIPSDISLTIYKLILNSSAQTIINHWYSHVLIHNINLTNLVQTIQLHINYDPFGMPFYYYNLEDRSIGIIFNICFKLLNLRLSSIDWWLQRMSYAFNSFYLYSPADNTIISYNYQSISRFYNKLVNH